MKTSILLVEDERNFATILKDFLKMNGYDVTLCENGELGWSVFNEELFDLCIIDVMMPKKDGFTLATEIKNVKPNTPIIFLTAKTLRDDVIKGYSIGADDYVTKPFDSEVLLYKIKAVLNRKLKDKEEKQTQYKIGKFNFDVKMRVLKNENLEIKLSPKEGALLELLCEHINNVLPREKALKQIWKEDTYFNARSMDVYIVKLRKHLSSDTKISINNIHSNGYSLMVN